MATLLQVVLETGRLPSAGRRFDSANRFGDFPTRPALHGIVASASGEKASGTVESIDTRRASNVWLECQGDESADAGENKKGLQSR